MKTTLKILIVVCAITALSFQIYKINEGALIFLWLGMIFYNLMYHERKRAERKSKH